MFLDREEMKFAILYTMKRYVEPMSATRLNEVLSREMDVMDYFALSELLEELTEDGYTESNFYKDDLCYHLSQKGKETNSFFFERVPGSIRKKIEKLVHTMKFEEQINPNAIRTEILPTAPQQYMASLQMLDAGDPILELKLFAGSRAQAEQAAKKLHAQAHEIYQDLVKRIDTERN
ncbi:MAG: DUF4364 family protein [Clostridia bacterium]|nr:DUF4364 family protein [Clostridia bacterium]